MESIEIEYRLGNRLNVDAVIDVYRASTIAGRPLEDRARMARMLEQADIVVTAWDKERLVGIARSLSDFAYATYLSDMAVDASYQKRGVGIELVRRTQAAGRPTKLILLAAPSAVNYYPRIGFRAASGWVLGSDDSVGTGSAK